MKSLRFRNSKYMPNVYSYICNSHASLGTVLRNEAKTNVASEIKHVPTFPLHCMCTLHVYHGLQYILFFHTGKNLLNGICKFKKMVNVSHPQRFMFLCCLRHVQLLSVKRSNNRKLICVLKVENFWRYWPDKTHHRWFKRSLKPTKILFFSNITGLRVHV